MSTDILPQLLGSAAFVCMHKVIRFLTKDVDSMSCAEGVPTLEILTIIMIYHDHQSHRHHHQVIFIITAVITRSDIIFFIIIVVIVKRFF